MFKTLWKETREEYHEKRSPIHISIDKVIVAELTQPLKRRRIQIGQTCREEKSLRLISILALPKINERQKPYKNWLTKINQTRFF